MADMDLTVIEIHFEVYPISYTSPRSLLYLAQHIIREMMFATVHTPTTPDTMYHKNFAYSLLEIMPMS